MITYNLLSYAIAAFILQQPTAHAQCRVEFSIDNAGLTVLGTLDSVDVNLSHNSINAIAYPASIHTGIAIRDQHLMHSDYFYTKKFPGIIIGSKSIESRGKNSFAGWFDITIKGKTKQLEISYRLTKTKRGLTYRGVFQINRRDFNLGEESLILSDIVTVSVEITQALE